MTQPRPVVAAAMRSIYAPPATAHSMGDFFDPPLEGLPSHRRKGGGEAAPGFDYRWIGDKDVGTAATIDVMKKLAVDGSTHPGIIAAAQRVTRRLPSKDYEAELRALFELVRENVRYNLDPRAMEMVQHPAYTMFVSGVGDCFVAGTQVLLKDGYRTIPIEEVRAGDQIWGKDRWSRVERSWSKGRLRTWLVRLNNGSTMRLTPDHKVYVLDPDSGEESRITLRELRPGMLLTQPESVATGTGEQDPDMAYLDGVYLSDGWAEQSRFAISGKDGHPKEEQKRRVQGICSHRGIRTRWAKKYISILDRDLAQRMLSMGSRAFNKKALTIDLEPLASTQLLSGIMADSGRNTSRKEAELLASDQNLTGRTFTTTSYALALQVRILLKQQGISCGESYVPDHGGEGTHPIWRLQTRLREHETKTHVKRLKVVEIIRDNDPRECFDISTDDHYVWLPQADWTVSNCDDSAVLLAALSMAAGHGALYRTIRTDPRRMDEFSHVYPLLGYRNKDGAFWFSSDVTHPRPEDARWGWEAPQEVRYGTADWMVAGV